MLILCRECESVNPCQILVTVSLPNVDMSCHEYLPLWLLWANSSVAVVKSLPRFDAGETPISVIPRVIEESDALVRWNMTAPTNWISFIQFGTEHHEAVVRVHRNSSLCKHRFFM